MDIGKDYYTILGVLPSAEVIVIKAAYKALIKVYHPDRCKSSKEVAHAKTVEINEAYAVLSDTSKRERYDNHKKPNENDFSQNKEVQPDFSAASDILEQDWQVAIKYEPELSAIVNRLSKLSSKLVFFYKLTMIESKQFGEKESIAAIMELDFFNLYFGSNKDIQMFAKMLLLDDERDAVKELNKAVTVLGEGINAKQVIEQIEVEFGLVCSTEQDERAEKKERESRDESFQGADSAASLIGRFWLGCMLSFVVLVLLTSW